MLSSKLFYERDCLEVSHLHVEGPERMDQNAVSRYICFNCMPHYCFVLCIPASTAESPFRMPTVYFNDFFVYTTPLQQRL